MYEIVVRIGEKEIVTETVADIHAATYHVSWHRAKGFHAFYRPVLKRAAYGRGLQPCPVPIEPPCLF